MAGKCCSREGALRNPRDQSHSLITARRLQLASHTCGLGRKWACTNAIVSAGNCFDREGLSSKLEVS